MPRNFWMITCNEENFNITRGLDFSKQGLKSEYRRKVQRVEKDDRVLYYVSGIRKFTATATVTASYKEEEPPRPRLPLPTRKRNRESGRTREGLPGPT